MINRVLTCFFAASVLIAASACGNKPERPLLDQPRLFPGVLMADYEFQSHALGRTMHYRVLRPATPPESGMILVYALHGAGATPRDWTNYSDVAKYALQGLLLVIPDGDESWYTNSASQASDLYEDYVAFDLPHEVRSRFPELANAGRAAIIGMSMGGYGAIKVALKHPEQFSFVGAMSPAVDVTRRRFAIRRIAQWRHYRDIFGPMEGPVRQANDVFALARAANPGNTPFIFISCGDRESLLGPDRSFANELKARGFALELQIESGGHDWYEWNAAMPELFRSLLQHANARSGSVPAP